MFVRHGTTERVRHGAAEDRATAGLAGPEARGHGAPSAEAAGTTPPARSEAERLDQQPSSQGGRAARRGTATALEARGDSPGAQREVVELGAWRSFEVQARRSRQACTNLMQTHTATVRTPARTMLPTRKGVVMPPASQAITHQPSVAPTTGWGACKRMPRGWSCRAPQRGAGLLEALGYTGGPRTARPRRTAGGERQQPGARAESGQPTRPKHAPEPAPAVNNGDAGTGLTRRPEHTAVHTATLPPHGATGAERRTGNEGGKARRARGGGERSSGAGRGAATQAGAAARHDPDARWRRRNA